MKALAITLIMALLASTVPVFADGSWTSSQTVLYTVGETAYLSQSGILNFQQVPLGVVTENVFNVGILGLTESVDFYKGETRQMLESKNIEGLGFTEIEKQVTWTSPWAPTFTNEANIYVGWETAYAWDAKEVHNDGMGMFLYNVETIDPIYYEESFGLNMPIDCDVNPPWSVPVPPCCEDCVC